MEGNLPSEILLTATEGEQLHLNMVLLPRCGFDNVQLTGEIFPYVSLVKSDCNQILQLQRLKKKKKKSFIIFSGIQAESDDGRKNYNSFVFNTTASKKAKKNTNLKNIFLFFY